MKIDQEINPTLIVDYWLHFYLQILKDFNKSLKHSNVSEKHLFTIAMITMKIEEINKQVFNYENDKNSTQTILIFLSENLNKLEEKFSDLDFENINWTFKKFQKQIESHTIKESLSLKKNGIHGLCMDVVVHGIGRFLKYEEVRNLYSTCHFFANPNMKKFILDKDKNFIVAGQYHSFISSYNGELYGFGLNDNKQLGLEVTKMQNSPAPLKLPSHVLYKQIAAGFQHTLILCENGVVYCFGSNSFGQLGLGLSQQQSTSTLLTLPINKPVKQISAGYNYTLVLCEDGSVYAFGVNTFGQLGLGHNQDAFIPSLVSLPTSAKPKQIATKWSHSIILCEDGSVYAFGKNDFGQLGLGHTQDGSTPKLLALPKDKEPIQIALGGDHTIILCKDLSIFVCGLNASGQLGLGHTENEATPKLLSLPINKQPKQIAASGDYSVILCEDGSVYTFGRNSHGQLGLGHTKNKLTPQLVSLPKDKYAKQIAAASYHALVLCKDGYCYAFGVNNFGQLGLGQSFFNSLQPEQLTFPKNVRTKNHCSII